MSTINKITIASILLLNLISRTSFAQRELHVGLGYEVPVDEFKWIYKPAKSISVGYTKAKEMGKGKFFYGGGIGFFMYEPKQDIFYFLTGDNEYGTATYSNYKMFQIYAIFKKSYEISDNVDFFIGGDIGYYYIKFSSTSISPSIISEENTIEGKGALAPKVGIQIKFTDNFGIQFQSRYNVYFSIGKANPSSAYYNPNLGKINFFWSNSIGPFIRF